MGEGTSTSLTSAGGSWRSASQGLHASGLTRRYGSRTVVDDVSFEVLPGQVVGFLGPNGAGKSTTLRMLCGLGRPDAGVALVDGTPVHRLPNAGRVIGVLLDASAVHRGRTVQENLSLVAQTIGAPRDRVPVMLEAVGLGAVARRRSGALSLGMRQRLALAVALVGRPRYLVLDEPLNGLDTEGISWVKDVVRGFAADGGGVLVSSHLMAEVSTLVERVVVIDRGRIVQDAPLAHVVMSTETALCRSTDDEQLLTALLAAGVEARAEGGALVAHASTRRIGEIAAATGAVLVELRPTSRELADAVLELTEGEFRARRGLDLASWGTDEEHLR
ncbi:ABC transporter ATP-binding protein [Cellulomonas xiejunii]|uniref:ABC transporter ATP-binding protein n=1 Tax=Cellulomonas xiejunii TaxID=2968083 RepID=UPI001D0EAB42|nr:ATP-binding cassette domain-containing protein [Cellulomonas xiejunii]MCC2315301.1 ATP-binding cassette domain-containing protein [Cellulomonas xiejunii]